MNQAASKFLHLLALAMLLAGGLAVPAKTVLAGPTALLLVNSKLDNNVDGDGLCTLREAIKAALSDADYHECQMTGSFYGVDEIDFSLPGTPKITLASDLPIITAGTLIIDGANAGHPVIINANGHLAFDIGSGADVILQHLTVQNGRSPSGGGAYNEGTLRVEASTFLNNVSTYDGGGINNVGGVLMIVNSTFSGNGADYGGGVTNNAGSASIYNSTFSGNSASEHGGALSTWQASSTPPTTAVHNTIFANSAAPEDCWNGAGSISGGNNVVESPGTGPESCSSITSLELDPGLGTRTGSPSHFPLQAGSPAIDAGNQTVCSEGPVYDASQNMVPRPQDGDLSGIAVCDIGSYELPLTSFLTPTAAEDGWIRETSETSGHGGTIDGAGPTLRLGDDARNRQYRAMLSFPTGDLPDNAVITTVSLRLKKQGLAGGVNPFGALKGLRGDSVYGYFGTSSALEAADFEAAAGHSFKIMVPKLKAGWYTLNLAGAKPDINVLTDYGGMTQIRLRLRLDDNNDRLANTLMLYSGDAVSPSDHPIMIVTYWIPPP